MPRQTNDPRNNDEDPDVPRTEDITETPARVFPGAYTPRNPASNRYLFPLTSARGRGRGGIGGTSTYWRDQLYERQPSGVFLPSSPRMAFDFNAPGQFPAMEEDDAGIQPGPSGTKESKAVGFGEGDSVGSEQGGRTFNLDEVDPGGDMGDLPSSPVAAKTSRRDTVRINRLQANEVAEMFLRSRQLQQVAVFARTIRNTANNHKGKAAILDNITQGDMRYAMILVNITHQAMESSPLIGKLGDHDRIIELSKVKNVVRVWRHNVATIASHLMPDPAASHDEPIRKRSDWSHLPEGADADAEIEDAPDFIDMNDSDMVLPTTETTRTPRRRSTAPAVTDWNAETAKLRAGGKSKAATAAALVAAPDDPGGDSSDDGGSENDRDARRRRDDHERKRRAKSKRRDKHQDSDSGEDSDASLGERTTPGVGTWDETDQRLLDASRRLKRDPIGSFDPNARDSAGRGIVTQAGKPPTYTDVFLFTLRIKEWTTGQDAYILSGHYTKLLGGDALSWLQVELDSSERMVLMSCSSRTFRKKLESRFGPPKSESQNEWTSVKYTQRDWRNNKSIAQFIQRKVALARHIGIKDQSVIITHIKSLIDPIIMIGTQFKPDRYTTISSWIKIFRDSRGEVDEILASKLGEDNSRNHQADRRSSDRNDRDDRSGRRDRDRSDSRRSDRSSGGSRGSGYWSQDSRNDNRGTYSGRSDRPRRDYRDSSRDRYSRDDSRNRDNGYRRNSGYDNRRDYRRDDRRDDNRRSNDSRRDDNRRDDKRVSFEGKYYTSETPHDESAENNTAANDPKSGNSSNVPGHTGWCIQEEAQASAFLTALSDPDLGQTGGYSCRICKRRYPTSDNLWAHGETATCIAPEALATDGQLSVQCFHCDAWFPSKTKMFKHLYNNECPRREPQMIKSSDLAAESVNYASTSAATEADEVLLPKPVEAKGASLPFNYSHMRIPIYASKNGTRFDVCPDSGCGTPIIDPKLLDQLQHTVVTKVPTVIRGVAGNQKVSRFATFSFYVRGKCAGTDKWAMFECGAWIMDCGAGALLGNAFLKPYQGTISYTDETISVGVLDDFKIPFTINAHSRSVIRRVNSAMTVTVAPNSMLRVPARWKELPANSTNGDRAYSFEATHQMALHAVVDRSTAPGVMLVNNTDQVIVVDRGQTLGHLRESEDSGYLAVDSLDQAWNVLSTATLPGTATIRHELAEGRFPAANTRLDLIPNSLELGVSSVNAVVMPDSIVPQTVTPTYWASTLTPLSDSIYSLMASTDSTVASEDPFEEEKQIPFISLTKTPDLPERKLDNEVHIFAADHGFCDQAEKLVGRYSCVFQDTGLVKVDQNGEMAVPLVDGWQEQRTSQRMYPQGKRDRDLIDQIHDDLHTKGRMEWATEATPFTAPLFVVWKDVEGKPKGRVVIDLRALNKVTVPDNYPLPRQEELISDLNGCTHITVIDASSFFFQFGVRLDHRNRFTVTSHRGLERFTVAPMGFRNSPAHAQRFMDRILRPHKNYCKGYIDDIIIFSTTSEDHLIHLERIFQLLERMNVSISPKKSWIGYPSAQVLGFRVDGMGMTTTHDRVAAFAKLDFPAKLNALESYVGATGYLRHLIPYYGQLIEPLQDRKVALLAEGRKIGRVVTGNKNKRMSYTRNTTFEPTEQEKTSFAALQAEIASGRVVFHHDPEKKLFCQLDASLERGFACYLFHLVDGYVWEPGTLVPSTAVRPILFASRCLTKAERSYGPTELEVGCLVWSVRRMYTIIQSNNQPLVVLTDHSATRQIVDKTTMETASTDRANRRLINASIYLSQFAMEVYHLPGKKNFIPDALSRLAAPETDPSIERLQDHYTALDDVFLAVIQPFESALLTTEAVMADTTKDRFIKGYDGDTHFKNIMDLIVGGYEDVAESSALTPSDVNHMGNPKLPRISRSRGLPFHIKDGLLYHEGHDGVVRLCVPRPLEKEFLEMAHDNSHHYGVERMLHELKGFAISRITKKARKHIAGCKGCCLGQNDRQQKMGAYKPIRANPLPMQSISMDFITNMPPTSSKGSPWAIEGFDYFDQLCNTLCMTSKRALLVPGHSTYDAHHWAGAISRLLLIADWGLPRVIISDRDSKFTSGFWKGLWEAFGTKLAMTTAWHPQADGANERRNQVIETAIRLAYIEEPDLDWKLLLPSLQFSINSALNNSTSTSAHEFLYGHKVNGVTGDHGDNDEADSLQYMRPALRQQASLALDLAAARAKQQYDARHRPVQLRAGDMVYLNLHDGYNLPGQHSKKWSQRREGPFKINHMVNDLAASLELPKQIRIHPVVSVQHLKLAPAGSYVHAEPGPVEASGDIEDVAEGDEHFEIDRVYNKRVLKSGKTQYRVSWKGYKGNDDQWVDKDGVSSEAIRTYEEQVAREAVNAPSKRRSLRLQR